VALQPLATLADLEERLGQPPTNVERAAALLVDASAAVRAYTGQEVTRRVSTVRLRPVGSLVRLSQRPVNAAPTAVVDIAGNAVSAVWDGFSTLSVSGCYTALDVTYDHGFAEVPGGLVAVVCSIAARALSVASDQTIGLSNETIGAYSYTVGSAAASGGAGMLDAERAILDAYIVPSPAIPTGIPELLKTGGIPRFDLD
jgi:hypothetical protein